jgi:hypothetical protein
MKKLSRPALSVLVECPFTDVRTVEGMGHQRLYFCAFLV